MKIFKKIRLAYLDEAAKDWNPTPEARIFTDISEVPEALEYLKYLYGQPVTVYLGSTKYTGILMDPAQINSDRDWPNIGTSNSWTIDPTGIFVAKDLQKKLGSYIFTLSHTLISGRNIKVSIDIPNKLIELIDPT